MPTDTPDTSRAALEALAEQWRLARGATPSSNHEYINGLLDAGGRLAATLRALVARVVELEAQNARLREALGDMLDDCEPDRPGAPRLSIREAARAVLNGGDYEA